MLDKSELEKKLTEFQLYQYEFIKTDELLFSDNVRYICRTECPMYGKTWACPPGVGSIAECKEKCLSYKEALLITTVEEVDDIADMNETLATRAGHEKIAREIRDYMREHGCETYVLSTEACSHCEKCTYPHAPCRHLDYMFPCVESHGIVVTDIAEKKNISFLNGNIVMWFSIIFYR